MSLNGSLRVEQFSMDAQQISDRYLISDFTGEPEWVVRYEGAPGGGRDR